MNNTPECNKEEDAEIDVKPKVTLDTILANEIGQFGKFQLRILLLGALIAIFAAWGALEYVFTTARISTRCLIPECDSPEPEWSPYWLPNAVPVRGLRTFDNCQRYGNVSSVQHQVENDTCPSTLFDRNTQQACDEYVYENTHSVAYDGAQWFEKFPFVLFACFALISGALVFVTPETHNMKLPDTFEEACKSGKDKNTNKMTYYK